MYKKMPPGSFFPKLFLLFSFLFTSLICLVACDPLSSSGRIKEEEEESSERRITEIWTMQRVEISLKGYDKRYAYSFTDNKHFDNEIEEDEYGYYYVYSPYAYVLFNDKRLETLDYSADYQAFMKDKGVLFPLSEKNVEYYKIEDKKLFIKYVWHWEYDLGYELAYYIKSQNSSSIVLEVYGDAIDGYFNNDVPQAAWSEDSDYHCTVYYKKERYK